MAETQRVASEREMHREADSFTGGPGVVATKSQARGGLGGIVVGVIVGAILGLIVGAVLGGSGTVIAVIAFAVAGGVAGAVLGAYTRTKNKVTETGADVR